MTVTFMDSLNEVSGLRKLLGNPLEVRGCKEQKMIIISINCTNTFYSCCSR
jgi:hypothetical protein